MMEKLTDEEIVRYVRQHDFSLKTAQKVSAVLGRDVEPDFQDADRRGVIDYGWSYPCIGIPNGKERWPA